MHSLNQFENGLIPSYDLKLVDLHHYCGEDTVSGNNYYYYLMSGRLILSWNWSGNRFIRNYSAWYFYNILMERRPRWLSRRGREDQFGDLLSWPPAIISRR